ncbi:MAG TPA: hypothetical protein VL461_15080 [Dictyobacter sp.]|jgi:3-hydroxy-9,10-secoandrosta-1,3,5(10)-triene-9,17-dione monooxygenase|nr:hypothetical protein [Dictyobacter sp.]
MEVDNHVQEDVWGLLQKLLPLVQEYIPQSEQLRRQPVETIQAMLDAKMARVLMPKQWGGYELSFDLFVRMTTEVAKVDASAGLCFSFLLIHPWFLALFPEQAQRDVWSSTPDVALATSLAPQGQASRVAGGYQLKGRWAWSSGVDHCSWNMLTALVTPSPAGGALERRIFLLPRSDYEILDTWHVAGLKASGSNDVIVQDAFVPEHRTVNLLDLARGMRSRATTSPLYSLPLFSVFPISLTSVLVGSALGAYETWKGHSHKHLAVLTDPVKLAIMAPLYVRVAEIATTLDTVQLLLQRALTTFSDGGPLTDPIRMRNRRDFAYIAHTCQKIVNTVYESCGAWANFDWHHVQRHWRDCNALAAHTAFKFDVIGQIFGRAELGLPQETQETVL